MRTFTYSGAECHFAHPLFPILLTAENQEGLDAKYTVLKKTLSNNGDPETLATGLAKDNSLYNGFRGVAVYNTHTNQLELAFKNQSSLVTKRRPVVFMFAGVGGQYLNMARGLYNRDPLFKKTFNYCCNFLEPLLGKNLNEVIFPPNTLTPGNLLANEVKGEIDFKKIFDRSATKSSEEKALSKTVYLHPLLFTIEYSLAQLLITCGITPEALIGHSVGEYVAATIAGVLSLDDALTLVAKRAQLIEKLPHGAMLTILTSRNEIDPILEDNNLFLAAENSPISCSVSGVEKNVAAFEAELEKRDIAFLRLATDHPFHSPLMQPIKQEFTDLFKKICINPINIPFLSNLTGKWATNQQMADSNNWFLHTCETVRFSSGVKKLLEIKDGVFIEIGSGQTLSGFTFQHKFKDHNPNALITSALKSANDSTADNVFLFNTLCKLWTNGVAINWGAVFKHADVLWH